MKKDNEMATAIKKRKTSPAVDAACSVVPVRREVLNDQLLVALDDKSKVAIICDQNDIELLMFALTRCDGIRSESAEMWRDLKKLRDAAFRG